MGNENENKQNESRWFLIEHKDCGSILTIKSDKYLESVGQKSTPLVCPSCLDEIEQGVHTKLEGFLNGYKELTNFLETRHFSIREIQREELEAIKSPYKLSK